MSLLEKLQFTKMELRDIAIATLVLTLIFSFSAYPSISLSVDRLIPAFIVVVTAFILHEMAHKFMAIKYRCDAYFKIWPQGLLLGLLTMFLPFKFVAPGATVIHPHRHGRWMFKESRLTVKEVGVIGAVGPMVNIVLALIFLPFAGLSLFNTLFSINAYLAFFNLLPIPPLDGSKVIAWTPWMWFFMIVLSGILSFTVA